MPTVPSTQPVQGRPVDDLRADERPSPEYMLMAAAAMKEMGRLYNPPEIPTPKILEQARDEYWTHFEKVIKQQKEKIPEKYSEESLKANKEEFIYKDAPKRK